MPASSQPAKQPKRKTIAFVAMAGIALAIGSLAYMSVQSATAAADCQLTTAQCGSSVPPGICSKGSQGGKQGCFYNQSYNGHSRCDAC